MSTDRIRALGVKSITAVVQLLAVVIGGLGLYLLLFKSWVLARILNGVSMFDMWSILGQGDIFMVAAILGVLSLAYSFRSDPETRTNSASANGASDDPPGEPETGFEGFGSGDQ